MYISCSEATHLLLICSILRNKSHRVSAMHKVFTSHLQLLFAGLIYKSVYLNLVVGYLIKVQRCFAEGSNRVLYSPILICLKVLIHLVSRHLVYRISVSKKGLYSIDM